MNRTLFIILVGSLFAPLCGMDSSEQERGSMTMYHLVNNSSFCVLGQKITTIGMKYDPENKKTLYKAQLSDWSWVEVELDSSGEATGSHYKLCTEDTTFDLTAKNVATLAQAFKAALAGVTPSSPRIIHNLQ